jgi:hypothetical protein
MIRGWTAGSREHARDVISLTLSYADENLHDSSINTRLAVLPTRIPNEGNNFRGDNQ